MKPQIPYSARAFKPAHPDLAMGAGVPAQLSYERYVESLARIVFYWGMPAVDTMGRTNGWQLMKAPGATMGLFPGAPKNTMGYLDDYMPPAQRKVVTPNNDTIYGVGLFDLGADSVVIQTPTDAPKGHYWTIQIVDVFTTVTHQLGSASGTLGGSSSWSARTGTGRSPRTSSTCCARRPTWAGSSAEASRRTRRSPRRRRAPCSIRSASIR